MAKDQDVFNRQLASLRFALGDVILAALADRDVVEILANDDGKVWTESKGIMRHVADISADDALTILLSVASFVDSTVNKQNPAVKGELPLNGERFAGFIPPVVRQASFAIRKKAEAIYPLPSYVRSGELTLVQYEILRQAIQEKKNILVVGSTGSGKTTFVNALLDELARIAPERRMLLLEDKLELQCALANRLFLRASDWTTVGDLAVMVTLLRPDSITVGEVREGGPSLALLKLWNTGHPGGFATIHADSALQGLTRLDQLIQEVSVNPQCTLIAEAVAVVVFLHRPTDGQRVKEIVRVTGYDRIEERFMVEAIS